MNDFSRLVSSRLVSSRLVSSLIFSSVIFSAACSQQDSTTESSQTSNIEDPAAQKCFSGQGSDPTRRICVGDQLWHVSDNHENPRFSKVEDILFEENAQLPDTVASVLISTIATKQNNNTVICEKRSTELVDARYFFGAWVNDPPQCGKKLRF
jgi:hypothetical protein